MNLRLLSPLLCIGPLLAQVNPGDIGVSGLSSDTFRIFGSGGVVTAYVTAGFGGTAQAILHDPANANDFLVGGNGFIGRCTVTAPGVASFTLITGQIGAAAQMSWDDAGQLIVADSGSDQVLRVDPVSGAITSLSSGTQPWGTTLNAGAYDRATGRVVLGATGGIYALDIAHNQTSATLLYGGLPSFVYGIAFDPLTGEVVAAISGGPNARLVRFSPSGVMTDLTTPFAGMNAVDFDGHGDFVTSSVAGLFRVAYLGGAVTNLGNNVTTITGVSVVRGGGYAVPFGQGCNGVAGQVALRATLPIAAGGTLTLTSNNHAAGCTGVQLIGWSNTTYNGVPLPFLLDPNFGTANCNVYASLDMPVIGFATATAPADLTISLVVSAALRGHRIHVQHAALEAVAGGMSWSNGLAVQFE